MKLMRYGRSWKDRERTWASMVAVEDWGIARNVRLALITKLKTFNQEPNQSPAKNFERLADQSRMRGELEICYSSTENGENGGSSACPHFPES